MGLEHEAWGFVTVVVFLVYFVLVIGWLVPVLLVARFGGLRGISRPSISGASHRRRAYADLMAFSGIGNGNRTLRASLLPFDLHGRSNRSATSLAEVDKRCYEEGAHVLTFHREAMLGGVQNAFCLSIQELVGLANEGLRPSWLFLRHCAEGDLLSAR